MTGNHSDTIAEDVGTKEGGSLNQNMIIETNGKSSTDKGHSNLPGPVAGSASTNNLVHESVIKNESESEAAPASQSKGSNLSEFLENKSENETSDNGASKDSPGNPCLGVGLQEC